MFYDKKEYVNNKKIPREKINYKSKNNEKLKEYFEKILIIINLNKIRSNNRLLS